MAYSLDDYNTVPERIAEAKATYPDGRFQSEVIELPAAFADKFIAVRATFYRTADDPTPAVGLAWEPVPGATNFTRQSELMNAETSAWGRALIAAFAADAKKGIASREEIQNREPEPRPRSGGQKRLPNPPSSTDVRVSATSQETDVKPPPANGASDVSQFIRDAIAGSFKEWSDPEKADSFKRHAQAVLGGKATTVDEAMKVIIEMEDEYMARFPQGSLL